MPDKEKKPKRKLVGGQAVMGGVMMRGRKKCFMALKSPYDGRLELTELPLPNFLRWKIFKWPLFRGTSMLLDSAVLGTQALTASANFVEKEEQKKKAAEEGKPLDGIDEKPGLISGRRAAFLLLPSLLIGVAIFILGPLWAARGILALWPAVGPEGGIWFNLIEGGLRVLVFLIYLVAIRAMKDVRELFRFHGAEHKTIAAFEAGEELTIANVAPKSRLHPRCGTGFLVFMLIALVLVHSAVFAIPALQGIWFLYAALIRIALIPLVAGVAYEWIRLAGRHPESRLARILVAPGLATQLLTTVEPEERHLECAIAAFKAVVDAEGPFEDSGEKRPIAA